MADGAAPKPVLLLDVGLACTGVAVATMGPRGPRVALDALVPEAGMSPKSLRDRRAHERWGNAAARLYEMLVATISDRARYGDITTVPIVLAEVPVLGARNAGGMRSMSIAIAVYRAACTAARCLRADFTRYDVLAAAFGKRKPKGDGKAATRRLVRDLFEVDASRLTDDQDDAYDAAAVLFAARDHDLLRRAAGWGDAAALWRDLAKAPTAAA